MSNNIYVGNLPFDTTSDDLKSWFSEHGTVTKAQVATDRETGRSRGFGFLTRGEGTEDIFVHMETLRRYGITELRPGQSVLVRFAPGPKGLMASEVHPDGVPHVASH